MPAENVVSFLRHFSKGNAFDMVIHLIFLTNRIKFSKRAIKSSSQTVSSTNSGLQWPLLRK